MGAEPLEPTKEDVAATDTSLHDTPLHVLPSTENYTPSTEEDAKRAGADRELPRLPGYRIIKEIARGGMGKVYAGFEEALRREVAIKTLRPGTSPERFVVEARITAQLPHPNIPPVYALGTLDDGSPYLAMKLIRGSTLAQLLKARPSPQDELSRFLSIFEKIAEAVGFAHARGIIHRDLKPSNVMVGEFGEVQVMDWGLAKDLKVREAEPATSGMPICSDLTATGIRMGTPGYASPEQARGEKLDARTDVYALGLILAEILIGGRVVEGDSVQELWQKSARGDVGNLESRLAQCGVDQELVELCRQCLALRAEDRPANAQEVAQAIASYRAGVEKRLKRAETEQAASVVRTAEQQKRRRLAILLGSGLLLVLVSGLGASLWQMYRAKLAEGEARIKEETAKAERDAKVKAIEAEQASRRQALLALMSLTDEMVERKLAQGQGHVLTEADRAFLKGVLQRWEAFASLRGEDAESRAIQATGRLRVGMIRHRFMELKEAEADLDAATATFHQLLKEFPTQVEYRQELATSYHQRGLLRCDLGRLSEAAEDYARAVELREQLATELPSHPEPRMQLASSLNARGNLQSKVGRIQEALDDFGAALAFQTRLVADFPARPEFRHDLAGSHLNRANLLRQVRRVKEALEDYKAALEVNKPLADEFPSRPEFRQSLAQTHNSRALLYRSLGHLTEALEDYQAALAVRKQLAADFPTRPEYRQNLATSFSDRGNLYLAMGRSKEALEDINAAVVLRRQLAEDFPARPEYRQHLATILNNRGSLLKHTGRRKEAQEDFDAAVDIRERLAKEFPTRPELQQELAAAFNNRGLYLQEIGRLQEALHDLNEALKLRKHLVSAAPARPELHQDLAQSHNNLGILLLKMERTQEALVEYNAALEIRRKLADEFPSRADFRQNLAISHKNRGLLLHELERTQEAVADYSAALTILKELMAEFPSQPDYANELAGTSVNLALLHQQTGALTAAKQLLLEHQSHHLAALKANSRHGRYRSFFRNHLCLLAEVQAGLLEPEEARRTAALRRDVGWDPPADAYDAAVILSRCLPIVAKHEKLSEAQRQQAEQAYGAAVIEMLREAVQKGFKDVARLKSDASFAPVHQRAEFKQLVAELEARAGK